MALIAPVNPEWKSKELYDDRDDGWQDPWLNVDELAEYFRVTERTIRTWVEDRGLPVHLIRGVLRFPLSKVIEWVDLRTGRVTPDVC